jgi:cytochrome c oxidase subunit II
MTRLPHVREHRVQQSAHLRFHEIFAILAALALFAVVARASGTPDPASLVPNVFKPDSTPADHIYSVAMFVLAITGAIFVTVFSLLVYAVTKFRAKRDGDNHEPAQVYGSNQIELAWTVIPVLIVVMLFLATARVVAQIEDAPAPPGAIQVTAIGHQFWWEFRYPELGVVTANELHVPVSDPDHPTPTFLKLLSADTDHSFWVPRLAGKTDLIPNRVNHMWIDPHHVGLYLGQCAQYCGTQHGLMLLRVYVDSREDFQKWIHAQAAQAASSAHPQSAPAGVVLASSQQSSSAAADGRRVFESTSCINCHAVQGTIADGRFGPDLTHLMSRATIASGAADNTPENLKKWIDNPDSIKPGSLMPAMRLTQHDLNALTAYLETLQ